MAWETKILTKKASQETRQASCLTTSSTSLAEWGRRIIQKWARLRAMRLILKRSYRPISMPHYLNNSSPSMKKPKIITMQAVTTTTAAMKNVRGNLVLAQAESKRAPQSLTTLTTMRWNSMKTTATADGWRQSPRGAQDLIKIRRRGEWRNPDTI